MENYLNDNQYPGRGIIMGCSPNGIAVIAYFITGRSSNSQNRVLVKEKDGIYTKPADKKKVQDPSLIIYRAIADIDSMPIGKTGRYRWHNTIVTNGDQTDTIFNFLQKGLTFPKALATREYEPDAPHYTTRISGIMEFGAEIEEYIPFRYNISSLKHHITQQGKEECMRSLATYSAVPGIGHIITTYSGDGNPLPQGSNYGDKVFIPENPQELADDLWNQMNENYKISLYVRYTNPITFKYKEVLLNKYEEVK